MCFTLSLIKLSTWVKQTFHEADKNGDGLLNIEEIHQLMHKLNVNLPRRKVRQMFQVGIIRLPVVSWEKKTRPERMDKE